MKKSSSNIYYPTGIKMKSNYCENSQNQLIQNAMSGFELYMNGTSMADQGGFPRCPLKGTYMLNLTWPILELDPTLVPTGAYRWDNAYRMRNGTLLYKTTDFVYANGVAFRLM
jgi:hypothetical protein